MTGNADIDTWLTELSELSKQYQTIAAPIKAQMKFPEGPACPGDRGPHLCHADLRGPGHAPYPGHEADPESALCDGCVYEQAKVGFRASFGDGGGSAHDYASV